MTEGIEFTANTINDPDPRKLTEELVDEIKKSATVPKQIKRIAARSRNWGVPRSFVGYRVDPTVQALGNARKWILRSEDGGPDYIIKYPDKNGLTETLTELLINQLGADCGFDMAHSGLASVDGIPVFVTRSFLGSDEHLVHGSFLIEESFRAKGELARIPRNQEQEFYSIDFVVNTIHDYCGEDGASVVTKFVEMLVFDAVVGSNDRHPQNWGVIRASKTQAGYRFSPIFDTSRALLWNTSDAKLQLFARDPRLLGFHIARARPLLGPETNFLKTLRLTTSTCNHFQFLQSLFHVLPHLKGTAITKVPSDVGRIAAKLLREFPFRSVFTKVRREMIVKLISLRADQVCRLLEKGGEIECSDPFVSC
ncbi:MAG TPA: HipA domain-containing protein [Terriglobales bacterium]|jgi:hypothetical protein